jgi:hypothetical protein
MADIKTAVPQMGRSSSFSAGVTGQGPYATVMTAGKGTSKNLFHPSSVLNATQIAGFRPKGDGNSADDSARQTPYGQLSSKNDATSAKTYSAITPQYQTRLAA